MKVEIRGRITIPASQITPGSFQPGAYTIPGSLTIAQGVIAALAQGITQTVTWNNAAVVFVAQDLNVTDTASDAASIIAQWRVGGVSKASITKAGVFSAAGGITAGGTVSSGWAFNFTGSTYIMAPANGRLLFSNAASTGFTRLTLGPTETALFPSLKVNGPSLQVRLGDDSGFAPIAAATLAASGAAATPGATGLQVGGTQQLTVGAAGGASAQPATPLGYIIAYVGATKVAIPYHQAA